MINEKINEVQYLTIKDTLEKLNKYGKCLMVRPTGFGKTRISSMIMDNYKNVIYCYPLNNIRNSVSKYSDESVVFVSYRKLCDYNSNEDEFKIVFTKYNSNDTLFIFDEAHFIGASRTSICVNKLMNEICFNAHFLGMTATPQRTDGINIEIEYFNGIVSYNYNMTDALNDGIFVKPYYVYCTLNDDSLYKLLLYKINNSNLSDNKINNIMNRIKNQIDIQILTIDNIDLIIKKYYKIFRNSKGYYKFLCFFSTFEGIHNKEREIIKAFKTVFPRHNIRSIIVSSENHEFKNNLNIINEMNSEKNTIDLIFNINMLTFGYHVSNITGVMMFRSTRSNIVYTQQVGRCFSVVQNHQTIIFDFVENLNKNRELNIQFNDITSKNIIDKLNLVLSSDNIILDENTKDFIEILKMIEQYDKNAILDEVIRAYKNNLVDVEYCMKKLNMTYNEFMEIMRRI